MDEARSLGNEEVALLNWLARQYERYTPGAVLQQGIDLGNTFYWLFELTGYLALADRTFEQVNATHFGGRFVRPRIKFCKRSTGGYYDKRKHEIGISLAMTVELGRTEFLETLLHELAHLVYQSHDRKFYELLSTLGGSGKKAPETLLLRMKREYTLATRYPIVTECPHCKRERRFRDRRGLRYACRSCCDAFAGGKFDPRFKFTLRSTAQPTVT